MEHLKETKIMEFNPSTIEEVRKELNLDRESMEQKLNSFEEWIAKQNHFTMKNFSRPYLESCIINAKGSLERAKTSLDKLCTWKTLLPKYFEKYNYKDNAMDTSSVIAKLCVLVNMIGRSQTHPQQRSIAHLWWKSTLTLGNSTSEHCQIPFFHQVAEAQLNYERSTILMNEYAKLHDYRLGYVVVIDCRNINVVQLVSNINILELREALSIVVDGYACRIKDLHVISASKTVEVFTTLLKQLLSNKLAGRINVLKTVEELYEYVPKEMLPKDYGGNEATMIELYENWRSELSTEESVEFLKMICNARTDEKHRLTDQYNDQILGIAGSFRTLSVD